MLAAFALPAFSQSEPLATTPTEVATQQSATQTPEESTSLEQVTAPIKPTALQWMLRLSASLKQLNFDTSFVVVRNNRAEPYRWIHGVEGDKELELISVLNGPRKEAVRVDNLVSYIEPDIKPYSVQSKSISGPLPSILSGDISHLAQTYNFISVGKSRILGRSAQLIRLESKDKQRFSFWVWLDAQSGLLLKSAIIGRDGELLEQIQFTHLSITEHSNDLLHQLLVTELPEPINTSTEDVDLVWSVSWVPEGFTLQHSNRKTLGQIDEQVESLLYNDGLVDVSVYVSYSKEMPRKPTVNQAGATVLLSQLRDGYEINVVGQIPATTALAIADSVTFSSNK